MEIMVHDIIKLIVNGPWAHVIAKNLGDIPYLYPEFAQRPQPKSLIRITNISELPKTRFHGKGKDVFVGDGCLWDRKYKTILRPISDNEMEIYCDYPSLEWIVWSLQIMLLKTNRTFVHAAGLEKGGKVYVFAGSGGVGKTSLTNYFVRILEWNLLGDDFVILSKDGMVYGFPKPMVVYPYHREIFPDIFISGKGPLFPNQLSSLINWSIPYIKTLLRQFPKALQFARDVNPLSACLSPSSVYGRQKIALQGKVGVLIWLERTEKVDKAVIVKSTPHIVASKIAGSTLNELDHWCNEVVNIACAVGVLSFYDVYCNWLNILEAGLKNSQVFIIGLPYYIAPRDIGPTIEQLLVKEEGAL
jgi:hypothetical protein